MLIVAIIDLPDDKDGTAGDAADRVTEGVLARVVDECGYADDGGPYSPAEVVVHALDGPTAVTAAESMRVLLDHLASATSRGHGPLIEGRT